MARIVDVSEQVRDTTPVALSPARQARQRRGESRGARSGLKRGDGWLRNAADERVLEWSTRLGAMTINQAHRYIYGATFQTARKRIGRMAQAGLLQRLDTVPWAGVVFWPTTAGRQAVTAPDSPLRAMEAPADSTLLHRLLVAEEALKRLAAGKVIITEREARLYESGTTDPEMRDMFLETMGVRRSIDGTRGVVPAIENTPSGPVERVLTLPTTDGTHTSFRIPDLIEVTKHGELRAIEVETALKTPSRMRQILAGYRDATLGHNQVMKGSGHDLKSAGPLNRQFRSVTWVATDAVMIQLRGYPDGINPYSGQRDIGLVRPVWADSLTSFLFYEDSSTWALDKPGWPLAAEPLDISHDPGLEYQLHQRTLPANYRTSMANWRRWRRLWEKETGDDEHQVPFVHWLRAPGVLPRCLELTGGA